jgi:hypothetical protein
MVDSTGPLRRLQGLVAMGWTLTEIGEAAGISASQVGHWLAGVYGKDRIYVKSAERIRLAYDRLSMKLPPEVTSIQKRDRTRNRNIARARGWMPPLAWDDETIDDPKAKPRNPRPRGRQYDEAVVDRVVAEGVKPRRLTHAEAAEAVRRLRRMGVSDWSLEHEYGFQTTRYPKEAQAS